MATLRDAFDRNLEVDVKLTNVDELKAKLLTTLQSTSQSNVNADKLATAVEKFSDIKDEIKEMTKLVEKMLDVVKKNNSSAEIKKEAAVFAKEMAKEQADVVSKLERKLSKSRNASGGRGTGDVVGARAAPRGGKSLQSAIVALTEAISVKTKKEKESEKKQGRMGLTGSFERFKMDPKGGVTTGIQSVVNLFKDVKDSGPPLQNLISGFAKLGGAVAGLVPVIGQGLSGAIEQIILLVGEQVGDFQKTRQAAFITGGTKGNKATDERAESIFQIKKLEESVLQTNQSNEKVLEATLKNFRRGIREQTKLDRVTKSGLNTASLIGAKAEDTNELFADWSQHLGASNNELSIMGRGLQQIARTSGVFGDNLLSVAKSSMTFLQTMRESGTFTAKAANNITNLLAEAQKRGVSKGIQNLLGVLSTSILEGGGKAQTLALIGAGGNSKVAEQLVAGTAGSDKSSLKIMAANWKIFLNTAATKQFGTTFDKLSKEQKGIVSVVTRKTAGVGAEELNQMAESAEEASKSLSELVTGLDQKVKKGLLTESEKQEQKRDMLFQAGSVALNDFNTAIQKNGSNINTEFNKLFGSSEELQTTFKELAIDPAKGAEALLKKQAESVTTRLQSLNLGKELEGKQISPADIEKVFKAGDKEGIEKLINTLNVLNEKASAQAQRNADPITKIQMDVEAVKAVFKNFSFEMIQKWAGDIATVVHQIYESVKEIAPQIIPFIEKTWKSIESYLPRALTTFMRVENIVANIDRAVAILTGRSPFKAGSEGITQRVGELESNTAKFAGGAGSKTTEELDAALEDAKKMRASAAQLRKGMEDLKPGTLEKIGMTGFRIGTFDLIPLKDWVDTAKGRKEIPGKLDEANRLEKAANTLESAAIDQKTLAKIQEFEKGGGKLGTFDKMFKDQILERMEQRKPENVIKNAEEAMKYLPSWMQSGFKDQIEAAKAQTSPGSIYTHDVYLEELLNKQMSEMSAAMPYAGRTDEDVRKEMVTTGDESSKDIGLIEASAKETSVNTKKMVILLNTLVRAMARRKSSSGGGFEPPTLNNEPYLDEILNTEWPNSRQGRSVGLEFDMTDFS